MVASLQTSGNSNGAWLQHQHTATSRAASQLPLPKCLPPAEQAAAAVGQGTERNAFQGWLFSVPHDSACGPLPPLNQLFFER